MMSKEKSDIRELSQAKLDELILSYGEKKFRSKQIYEWLWKKGVVSFDDMSNLSEDLRKKLSDSFTFKTLDLINTAESKDGTKKYLFQLHDLKKVECVLIPTDDRVTVCISSQTGCNLGCKFCATANIKNARDLTTGEIFDQFMFSVKKAREEYDLNLSNLVLMGMGEPLLNYDNVLEAINKITDPKNVNFSSQRITLSTAGIIQGIKQLADDKVKFNLAISLHAANDLLRNSIMPVNKSNDLEKLKEAIKYFHKQTGSRVTYEYLMLEGVNDSLMHAAELADFCKIAPCKINLIEYNHGDKDMFRSSSKTQISDFQEFLKSKNLIVNIRNSRGKDISAACGQLANKC